VSNYISYLQQTFLIHEAECFDIKGKAILSSGRKYYLNDLSFRNYLSSSFDFGFGKHLENILYLHYRSLGYKVYVGRIGKEEIDFIIEKGKEKVKKFETARSRAEKYVTLCEDLVNYQ